MAAMYDKQCSSVNVITQVVAYTGTAATSTAFGTQTRQVRVSSNSACHYLVTETGNVVAATVSNAAYLPNNWVEYVTVTPGQKISVIRAATDGLVTATSGTLNITELS